jgi:L-aminopeptidase/D-esterase-like protein
MKVPPMTPTNDTLTRVPGIKVGHWTHLEGGTGCTVILCPPETVGGVDQRGGAPGTRETDLLRPMHMVSHVSALVLAGGSAFGLAAADGVMRYCEEHGSGFPSPSGTLVPIVPAAILYDLALGSADVRPDAEAGYAACAAASDAPVALGSVGAGTGCRIGGMMGNAQSTKGGIGSAAVELGGGLVVAALIAVNALGDVLAEDGTVLAGLRQSPDSSIFPGTLEMMTAFMQAVSSSGNTVIGVVATNARLNKEQANKVAQMAHDGLARAVRPAHTMFDGDTLFALATGAVEVDPNLVGAYAAEVTAGAIRAAVRHAASLHDVRALND